MHVTTNKLSYYVVVASFCVKKTRNILNFGTASTQIRLQPRITFSKNKVIKPLLPRIYHLYYI